MGIWINEFVNAVFIGQWWFAPLGVCLCGPAVLVVARCAGGDLWGLGALGLWGVCWGLGCCFCWHHALLRGGGWGVCVFVSISVFQQLFASIDEMIVFEVLSCLGTCQVTRVYNVYY